MADDDSDRQDRRREAGEDRTQSQLYDLSTKVAVLATKMEGLADTVRVGLANVDTTFREINTRYATKEDLKTVADNIMDVKKNLQKGVWIVLTLVIGAIFTVVFKSGLAHP